MTNATTYPWDGTQVMAASIEPMAVLDGERHVTTNQSYADLYEFDRPDDLAGEPWASRLAADDRPRIEREILPACRSDGRWRGTVTGRRRDGTAVPLELSVARLDEQHLLCVCREADRRDGDRRGVERHRQFVEQVFDAVDDVVYVLDEDGDAVLWNAKLREATGYTDAEIAALDPDELVAPDDHDNLTGLVETIDRLGDQHVVLDIVTRDGHRVPHEFRGTTFEDPETGRVYRCGVARDVSERRERERQLERERDRLSTLFEHVPTPVMYGPTCAEGPLIGDVNPAFEAVFGCDADEVEGMPLDDLIVPEDEDNEDLNRRVVEEGSVEAEVRREAADGVRDFRLQTAVVPLDEPRDGFPFEGWAMYTDITERKERERQLERQRDELETLNRINELLLEVTRDLFESPSRQDLEQLVCDRLAASELYQFAWVGEPETGGDRIVPRASAGVDDGYVEATTVTTGETETGMGPGGRAFRTGTVQVSQDVRSDPTFEPWREAALDRGVRSAAAVPLVHGDTTYGVLAVYATRPLAFSRREQAGFETLGKAVGFAINAIENRKLLFADTVVELEFAVTDPGLLFVRLSDRLACELTVTGYVESTSGHWSVYLTVDGAPPAVVRDLALDAPDVERARVVAAEGDGGALELVMEGPALNEVSEHGGVLTAGHVEDGRGRFSIETPRTTDVRQLCDRLREEYPESTLVAQREFDRPVRKAVELRQSLEDRLTDRQQEALTRAHHAGYFDWPRRSTAGDVAASMEIAETTFHYHLRNALDTLLTAFVDVEGR